MDFRIQDSNNPDPERFDKLFPRPIIFQSARLKVTIPIQLNAELDLNREKINDERSNALLPPELAPEQLPSFEPRPEDDFSPGHRPA
jgi:hypothetical protein